MLDILHIIQGLTRGGAGRSLVATAKYSTRTGYCRHKVISLVPVSEDIRDLMAGTGLSFLNAPSFEEILIEIQKADIVQVHFWNNPHIYEFLRSPLPSMRLLIWVHCAGNLPPQVVPSKLVAYSDMTVGCSPYTQENLAALNLPSEEKAQKIGMVFAGTDFDRCTEIEPKPHDTFNVGYLGTVDFVKMHPDYLQMSAAIDLPNIKIITVGKGSARGEFKQQVDRLGLEEKFEFIEYVEHPRSILEILDVFGYPLCEETYAGSELVLQEVMYCGIPPVVFPHGGVKRLVVHDRTGFIVNNAGEYREAIEYLYRNPQERARLGKNAREYAKRHFGAENAIRQLHLLYEKMMQQPKRERIWEVLRVLSGAECFVESLGDTAPQFHINLTAKETDALLESDRQIACASPVLRNGIANYCFHYSDDAHLKLWSGLIVRQLGQYGQAVSELSAAIALGGDHWRIKLYLARAAEQAGNIDLAQQTLRALRKTHSDIEIPSEIYTHLFNCSSKLLFWKLFVTGILQKLTFAIKHPKHSLKMFFVAVSDRFKIPLNIPSSKQ